MSGLVARSANSPTITMAGGVRSRNRTAGEAPYPCYGASGIVDSVDRYLFDGLFLLIGEDGENPRTRQTPIAFLARLPHRRRDAQTDTGQPLRSHRLQVDARKALNQQCARTLATLRDTLLPRLISGQLRLAPAQEAIAEATHAN